MSPIRLAELLAERLGAAGERTGAPLTVGELVERYVPYEVARRELDLEDRAEYRRLVLELVADPRLTELRDPETAEAARRALDSAEPDPAALEGRGDAALRLDLATISGGYRGGEGGTVGGDAEGGGSAADGGWDPTGGVERGTGPAGRPACDSCGRELPVEADVAVRFCPHCGSPRSGSACPGCGAALRPGWSWCPACGTEVAAAGPDAAPDDARDRRPSETGRGP